MLTMTKDTYGLIISTLSTACQYTNCRTKMHPLYMIYFQLIYQLNHPLIFRAKVFKQ